MHRIIVGLLGVSAVLTDSDRAAAQPMTQPPSVHAQAVRPSSTITVRMDGNVERIPVTSLAQFLAGRFAGIEVTGSGLSGSGSAIRVRGRSSLFSGGNPVVYVDGVRLVTRDDDSRAAVPSRFDDIDIYNIESIEIIKSLDGTLRYGEGAMNGVLAITTRQRSTGRLKLELNVEGGTIDDPNTYPLRYARWGKRPGGTSSVPCTLQQTAINTCVVDSVRSGNIMNVDSLTPIDVGYRSQGNARLSGGSSKFSVSLAGKSERETGVFRMPDRDQRMLRAERGVNEIPGNQVRPNRAERDWVHLNVSTTPLSRLNLRLSTSYLGGNTRSVLNGDNSVGITAGTLAGNWNLSGVNSRGVPLLGYFSATAGDIMSEINAQDTHRWTTSLAGTLRATSWLELHGGFGFDEIRQLDRTGRLAGQGVSRFNSTFFADDSLFQRGVTVNAGATVSNRIRSNLSSVTEIGIQLNADSASTAAVQYSPDIPTKSGQWTNFYSSREAAFLQERISYRDRLTLTGGVRYDRVNYYRTGNGPNATSPAGGISYRIARGTSLGWLDSLKVRANYAKAFSNGLESPTDGIFIETPFDRAQEVEGGFDVSARNGNVVISATAYRRSNAAATGRSDTPLGARYSAPMNVRNDGIELAYAQRVISRRAIGAEFNIVASANKNRVTDYPKDLFPIQYGNRSTMQIEVDRPLFSYRSRAYSYSDANNDGIIVPGEISYSDTATYVGPSVPTRVISFAPTLELLDKNLRITALFDSKSGYVKFNNTKRHQCSSGAGRACRGQNDPTATLKEQADAVAADNGVFTGMIEDASFIRLREAAITYELPRVAARAIGASSWTVVLSGRNLALWTGYSGTNPDAPVGTRDLNGDDYFSIPPMRSFTLRMNLTLGNRR